MTAVKVLAALGPNARDAKEAWERVDQLVAAGPAGEVVTLAEELCARKEPAWLVRSVSGRLLRQLAFSSAPGHFDLLLELTSRGLNEWTPLFEIVDCVAQRVDATGFLKALPTRERSVEFFASLLHSLVCHGADFEGVPEVQVFRDELLERQHRLALLPLRRTPVEQELRLARLSVSGSSSAGFQFPRVVPAQALAPQIARVDPAPEELGEATSAWHGSEVLQATLAARFAGALDLRSLPLASLRGGGLRQAETTASEVFNRLFFAAAEGGAYGGARGNAEARLAAFTSLAAFCEETLVDVAHVVEQASRCRWWLFEGTGWFGNVAWDFGGACLRPDGITLVVHAATDTD